MKVKNLFGSQLLTIHSNCLQILTACLVIVIGLLLAKLLIKIAWRHLSQADQGHVHSLVVRICGELILAIFVVQVGYVIVADARGLVVLAGEEYAGLGQINQCNYIRILLHELVLRELIVRD